MLKVVHNTCRDSIDFLYVLLSYRKVLLCNDMISFAMNMGLSITNREMLVLESVAMKQNKYL